MELRHILEILWRRKWIVISIFLTIFLTIFIGTLLITPWYDSTARVLLRKSSATASALASIGLSATTATIGDTDRADYLALATVTPVAEKVIEKLEVKRERTRARLMRAIPGLTTLLRLVGVDVTATEETMTAEDLLDSSILSNIFPRPYVSAEQYEETDIIDIKATSPDPEQAMNIANAMAEFFVKNELKRVRDDYLGVKEFIDNNIEKAKREYLEALDGIKKYKEKEKFVNLDSETSDMIQKISDLKKNIEDNKLAMYRTKASIKNIESQLTTMPKYQKTSEQLKDNEMISNLKLSLRDLYLTLAESKSKYTKDHPAVIDIENKIAEAKGLVQQEMEKVFSSETVSIDSVYQNNAEKQSGHYADLAGYEVQNSALPVIISKYEKELMKLPQKSMQYSSLQLNLTVAQDIYNALLKYQYQIGMAESLALSDIYLVESAKTPKRDDSKHKHPDLLLNTIIAIMLGTTFGIGAAFLLEYLDDTIKTPEDIKAKEVTFLGGIFVLNKKDPRLISLSEPRAPLRELIRTIRNSIRFATIDNPLKSVTVTSSLELEGKSFFAANLAISVANEGKKVLIIDCNMRNPGISNCFQLRQGPGLSDYLVGDADVNNIQLASGVEGVNVISTGTLPADPGRLIESQKIHQLIKEMEEIYDLVVIDTPPVLHTSDAIVLARRTDGAILVAQSGMTGRGHFADIIESLKRANVVLIGAVLNKIPSNPSHNLFLTLKELLVRKKGS